MTKQAQGAISTIELSGDRAGEIIREVFVRCPEKFNIGDILVGEIRNGKQTIDQAAIGCEGENTFGIHCHGNPLICEMIMDLLSQKNVELLDSPTFRQKTLAQKNPVNTIAAEAQIEYPQSCSLFSAKLIMKQVSEGLARSAKEFLEPDMTVKRIHERIAQILSDSEISEKIISPCRVLITGPVNSGKSTLLNALAGAEKSIVTSIKGTTRDWVSADVQTARMVLEVIDTAGIDETLVSTIDSESQQRAKEMIKAASLILFLLDINQAYVDSGSEFLDLLKNKKVITVLNKQDKTEKLDITKLPKHLRDTVKISAENKSNLDGLVSKIEQVLKTDTIEPDTSICFTERQKKICRNILNCSNKNEINSLVRELLNGRM
jgi:tRNA modification GTPase